MHSRSMWKACDPHLSQHSTCRSTGQICHTCHLDTACTCQMTHFYRGRPTVEACFSQHRVRCLQRADALTPESTCERLGKKAKPGRVTHSELSNLVWVGAQKSLYPAHPGWSGFDLNWYLHSVALIEKGLQMSGSEPTRLVPGPNTAPSGIALAHAVLTVQAAGGACQCAPGAEYVTIVTHLEETFGPAMGRR